MGWFNHQLELQLQKKIPLNKLTAIPLWSKLTPPTNTGNRWFFQIFFGGGSGLFVLVAHQKTWTCDLSSLMWFPKTTLSWTFHDWWWFSPTSFGSKHPFFFNYKATKQRRAIPTIGTWGAILESILKTVNSRPPWAVVPRLVWAVERAAVWAKERARGTPRRDTHGG